MKKASAKKQTKKPQQKTGGKGKQPVGKAPVKPPRHGPQALIHEREYEPKHISKEDVEFFSENSGYLSFLQSVDVYVCKSYLTNIVINLTNHRRRRKRKKMKKMKILNRSTNKLV
jgi:hypothetical protein